MLHTWKCESCLDRRCFAAVKDQAHTYPDPVLCPQKLGDTIWMRAPIAPEFPQTCNKCQKFSPCMASTTKGEIIGCIFPVGQQADECVWKTKRKFKEVA